MQSETIAKLKSPFRHSGRFALLVAAAALIFCAMPSLQAQTYTTLYTFTSPSKGENPVSQLIFAPNNTIIGSADYDNCCFELFSLSQSGTEKTIHRFPGTTGGSNPVDPAGYVLSADGSTLYGITSYGPTYSNCNPQTGCGAVFSVNLSTGALKYLHIFKGTPDGYDPAGNLVIDASGNLFGETFDGGTNSFGSVFEITSTRSEKILYSFKAIPDGQHPNSGLVRSTSGNLYGTTVSGGSGPCNLYGTLGCGVVFKVTTAGKETVLHSFQGGRDGRYPYGLIGDSAGNVYGLSDTVNNTTAAIFKVSSAGNFSILYDAPFVANITSIVLGPSGTFYGLANGGSSACGSNGCGEIFQLTPDGTGGGTVKILYSFNGAEGRASNNLIYKNGALYGGTQYNGSSSYGTIYKLVP